MIDQEIQRKIEDFRELGLPRYFPREGPVHLVEGMVSTIIGGRRAGKSFRALQVADELLKNGYIQSLEQVCPIDFDNPILSGMSATDLGKIQNTLLKIGRDFDLKTHLIFILDEIHKISGWETYVIDLSRNFNWKVIVTGSSSKLLKEDISTELRGKAVSSVIYPLSFGEFLTFKSCRSKPGSTRGDAEILRHFEEYLKWGGYPAIANIEDYTKETLFREYFDTMILKDIIQRYGVSKPRQCIQLYNYLLSNIAKPHTLQSAYEYLKESGFATSRDSIRDYIKWAEDSWLLFTVPIYSRSHKEQERNYRKLYCIDWALAIRNSIVWDGSLSRALENMVFLHLKRNYPRIFYYLTRAKRQEVDFIAMERGENPILAVQVCSDISQRDTLKRELEPLISTAKYLGTKQNLIITLNQEREFSEQGVQIKALPAWRWMLSQNYQSSSELL